MEDDDIHDDNNLEYLHEAGVEFLRAIVAVHGPEKAHEVWEAFGPAIGDDIKFSVFSKMLTGQSSSRHVTIEGPFEFNNYDNNHSGGVQKVAGTKAIRAISGSSLKEAKETIENASRTNRTQIPVKDSLRREPIARKVFITALKEAGLKVRI